MSPRKPEALSPVDLLRKLADSVALQAVAPNAFGYVPHAKQMEFHQNTKHERLFVAGNRSGKSLSCVMEGIWWLTHTHPYREVPPGPIRGRVVAVDFLNGVDKIILPLYKQWLPAEYLIGGLWELSYNRERHVLTLRDGSFVEFMSQDQDLDKFAGTSRHFVHFDEECPKPIFEECLMRLIDTGGDWWMSETPVAGMEWIYDDLYAPAVEGLRPHLGLIEATMDDNTYLSQDAKERLLSMFTPEERLMREKGQYTTVTGALFRDFGDRPVSDGGHIISAWHPKKDPDWATSRIYITGDHGFNNPTAWLWVAVNEYGKMRVFHEIYKKEVVIADHAAEILAYNKEWGIDPYLICGDPAMSQRNGISGDSIMAEYSRNGVEIQTKGIVRDRQPGLNKIMQYMKRDPKDGMPFYVITEDCQNHRAEMKAAKQARIVNKMVASRKNRPEGIREKDDHSIDALRYLVTLLPDLTWKDFQGDSEKKWAEDAAGQAIGGYATGYTGYDQRKKSQNGGWSSVYDPTDGLE